MCSKDIEIACDNFPIKTFEFSICCCWKMKSTTTKKHQSNQIICFHIFYRRFRRNSFEYCKYRERFWVQLVGCISCFCLFGSRFAYIVVKQLLNDCQKCSLRRIESVMNTWNLCELKDSLTILYSSLNVVENPWWSLNVAVFVCAAIRWLILVHWT